MRRTVATAEPLCEAVGMTPQLRDGLREIAYGQWEGKTPEEVNREFQTNMSAGWPIPAGMRPPAGKREWTSPAAARCLGRNRRTYH